MGNIISFPNLGISLGLINPVAFYILERPIMWYGIIIALGFLAALQYASKRATSFNVTADGLTDMLIYATPVAIIGARAYYVIFNYGLYRGNIAKMFRIWEGGIAIYGAIIGAVAVLWLFCRHKKISATDMLDVCALGLLIGQCVGRWGNFINAEAYGSTTTLPWAMSINNKAGVHPTFIYESLWNLIGFAILHAYSKKRKFSGEIFLMYVIWYGAGRFFIEGLRSDSLYLFGTGIRVSQFVAVISIIVALGLLTWNYLKIIKKSSSVQKA